MTPYWGEERGRGSESDNTNKLDGGGGGNGKNMCSLMGWGIDCREDRRDEGGIERHRRLHWVCEPWGNTKYSNEDTMPNSNFNHVHFMWQRCTCSQTLAKSGLIRRRLKGSYIFGFSVSLHLRRFHQFSLLEEEIERLPRTLYSFFIPMPMRQYHIIQAVVPRQFGRLPSSKFVHSSWGLRG